MTEPTRKMACARCNVELIPQARSSAVSGGGLVGSLIAFVGLVTMFGNAIVGIGLIIVGLILGTVTRGKRLVLICPKCKDVTKLA